MDRLRRSIPALIIAAGLATAAPACAAQGRFYYQRDYRDLEGRAYENGYRQGLEHGEHDARRGRDFAYAHDDDYRDADRGYRRSYGSIETYRRIFRQGYVDGYSEGYRGSHNSSRAGGYYSQAAQIGYRDGYNVGRDDARDRESYDPRRSKRYRQGDRGYDDRSGSRERYKQEYRAAFLQGYEQGFREAR